MGQTMGQEGSAGPDPHTTLPHPAPFAVTLHLTPPPPSVGEPALQGEECRDIYRKRDIEED